MAKTKATKVKEPQTYEEFLERAWFQFNVHDAREESNIPAPTYNYKVGEPVRLGNLSDCRVEEILKDGKLIHISHYDRGEAYGKPYDNHRRLPMLIWWVRLIPLQVEEATDRFSRPRVHTDYTQTSLDSLIFMAYRRGLIDSPTYQRDYVWTLEDKQRLVKSVFNRADIGKFLFVEYPHPEYRLEVVDGKQRLNALREFYEGRFEYEGKTWFQLSRGDKHAFMDIMVQTCKLDAERVKKSDILWLFLTVNSGGVPQTEEHIASARALYEKALIEEKVS